MKQAIIFTLIFSFCGGSSETATVMDNTTTTSLTSSTTTTYDAELAWDNFLEAWEDNLKTELTLSSTEMAMTEELNKLWVWQGDKNNLNQYLFEIEVNGLICSRIYNSMGWALLDEIHPIEKDYRSSHTYKCDESGSLYLFGNPFYYQGNWWIYNNIELDWDILDCDDPCGTRAQNYASKFVIDKPQITEMNREKQAEIKYRKGWEDNLISYPELTSDEIKTSLLLEEYEFEYEWSFQTIIEEVTFVCKHKTTGTSIMAFANENHPLLINEDFYRYQIEVHYNCSSEENDGFVLYGPLFFQDNQWWGFIEYEDEYSSNYDVDNLYAFMNKFVKRVSLGQEILPSS